MGVLVAVALVAGVAGGAEQAGVTAKEYAGIGPVKCDFGGDIRIRQIHFDEIPINVGTATARGGENHFFRFRTRLWGSALCGEDLSFQARVVNEFREYDKPDGADFAEFEDELVVDRLFADIKGLLDGDVDLRIGRQDLIYGTGKILLEGTPMDGSRTIYCDAVKLVYKGIENTTVDLLGIYNQADAELVASSEDYNLTSSLSPLAADEESTESGVGVYVKNKSIEGAPLELYYFFKNEEEYEIGTPRPRFAVGDIVEERDTHCLGFRVMPKLSDTVSANLEAALQVGEVGDEDTDGYMVDAVLNMALPCDKTKPSLGLGVYYLSGDDTGTTDDEGWNPLWGRWPQYSELYVYSWDLDGGGRWSNLMMPHVDLSLALCENVKAKALVGYMTAPEKDGPGTGDERGWLGTLRIDFTLAQKLLTDDDKLSGHLLAEVLDPGDYYLVDDEAHFVRWELSYAF